MFRSALIKLTLQYILILMVISLFFSVFVYQISIQEINLNVTKQQRALDNRPLLHEIMDDPILQQDRVRLFEEGRQRILLELLYANIGVFIIGGGVSYFLARKTLEPIEKSHESQVRFAADASHELRSPLAAMKTELEVALRDSKLSAEESRELLASNLEEVQRLELLSEGLLELAKEDGNGVIKQNYKLKTIIENAVTSLRTKAKEKGINIRVTAPNNLSVYGQQENLTELISIFLDNAIKYSEEGKKVEIKAGQEGKFAVITVSDQGFGIKEEDIPYIFDRFYRSDLSRAKNKAEGYGLGLAIAHKIIENHKGKVEVQSKLGVGTSVTVRLPRAEH